MSWPAPGGERLPSERSPAVRQPRINHLHLPVHPQSVPGTAIGSLLSYQYDNFLVLIIAITATGLSGLSVNHEPCLGDLFGFLGCGEASADGADHLAIDAHRERPLHFDETSCRIAAVRPWLIASSSAWLGFL